jgi:hypothetical protein
VVYKKCLQGFTKAKGKAGNCSDLIAIIRFRRLYEPSPASIFFLPWKLVTSSDR